MKNKSYKELEKELSVLLERIDLSEHEDLQDLLDDFEQGKKIISELEQRLKVAQLKVTKTTKGTK